MAEKGFFDDLQDRWHKLVDAQYGADALAGGMVAGAVMFDLLPTPGDAVYFELSTWLDEHAATIDPERLQLYRALVYYAPGLLWDMILIGAVVYTKGAVSDKLLAAAAIGGVGAVGAVLYNNYQRDKAKRDGVKEPSFLDRILTNISNMDVQPTGGNQGGTWNSGVSP